MKRIEVMKSIYDNPDKDFRKRGQLPEIWMLDPNSHFGIEYDVYSRKVVDLIPFRRCKVLDAGCGCGRISALIIQQNHEVFGIDYSDRAIKFAEIFVPEAKFYQVDLRKLDERNDFQNAFDVTILVDVLEHIPPEYHQQVVSKLANTLKSNGLLIISVPSIYRTPINRWHYKHFTLDEIKHLLRQANLEIKKVRYDYKICYGEFLLRKMWRFVQNRHWDLKFVRKNVIRTSYISYLANPHRESNSGRYIVVGQKRNF